MAGLLGCGKYEVWIKERGGDQFVGRIPDLSSLEWARKLNATSEASFTMTLKGASSECCALVGIINPWEHEIAIFRDGTEVWCGPIVNGEIDLSDDTVRWDARDLSAWFDKRYVEVKDNDQEFEEADITEVFNWLVQHAYTKEAWNMSTYSTGKLNIPIDRVYVAYNPPAERWGGNYPYVGDELRNLSDSGVDYTVVRRSMVSGNLKNSGGQPMRFTEQHWSKLPKIRIVGTQMATDDAVAGGGGGYGGWYDEQMWIERNAEARARFGLLEFFESVPDLDDADTTATPNPITERAQRSASIRNIPYEYLTDGALGVNAPVTFDELVPGRHVRIDLDQSCRVVQANYLLLSVKVSFSNGEETTSLELVPPGTDLFEGAN